jgi:hypothetical protein
MDRAAAPGDQTEGREAAMKLFWLYVGLVVSFSLVRFIVDREEKENEEKPTLFI